jgi:hypothetical protein
MQDTKAFGPLYTRYNAVGPVQSTLAASTTVTSTNASATASTAFAGAAPSGKNQIQIANTTTAWAYVNFGVLLGGRTVTAATVAASYPVAPGAVVAVTVDAEVNAASVILGVAPGTNTAVIFTRGEGV